MSSIDWKSRLLHVYKNKQYNLSDKEYIELFYSIQSHIRNAKGEILKAISQFLFSGCNHFNRFATPASLYTDDSYRYYVLFMESLKSINKGCIAYFEISKIKWDIYRKYNLVSFSDEDKEYLKRLVKQIATLKVNTIDQHFNSLFDDFKSETQKQIESLIDDTYSIEIKTTLPYKICDNELDCTFNYQGIKIKFECYYQYSNNPHLNVINAQVDFAAPTKWQAYESNIKITLNGILDEYKSVLPLNHIQDPDMQEYWPLGFKFTFEIIEKVWWNLKIRNLVNNSWIPTPTDIGPLEYTQYANQESVACTRVTPPGNIYIIQGNQNHNKLHLNELQKVHWHEKSYYHAIMSMEIGQLQESVFWINVAIEALIYYFVDNLISDSSIKEKIFNERRLFEEAEEIIREQLPDCAGKINWPDVKTHASPFSILKQTLKIASCDLDKKFVIKQYNQIRDGLRNELFHGKGTGNVDIIKLKNAIIAYEWLYENFQKEINKPRN